MHAALKLLFRETIICIYRDGIRRLCWKRYTFVLFCFFVFASSLLVCTTFALIDLSYEAIPLDCYIMIIGVGYKPG